MEASWGGEQCLNDLVVSRERLFVDSPINNGIFLADRVCSRACVERIVGMHEEAKERGVKVNDQEAMMTLMKNGTCRVRRGE